MIMTPEEVQNAFAPEELDPELVPYIDENADFPMLRHPLVYSVPYSPAMNKWINQSLHYKKKRLEELEAEGDLSSILVLYERPYRLDALFKYASKMSDSEYWRALGWIWTDTENFYENSKDWAKAVTADRPGREFMMDEDDRELYNSLPDAITIYRGQTKDHPVGMSWTTKKEIAVWFARRFYNKNGVVITAKVRKKDVIACFAGRKESEVVVAVESVKFAINCTEAA